MPKLTAAQLHILQHSLGVNKYSQGRAYRNHYVVGPGCDGFDDCKALVAADLMMEHAPRELTGGMYCFTVTDAGRQAVKEQSPTPPKLTRGQRRYRDFLNADCGMSFGDYLKLRLEVSP